jgi:uncharacterized protein (DUF2267 family)
VSRIHVFDPHLEVASRWLKELMENLELKSTEQGRALHALRAGLHAIRDRLPATEVLDLAAQLPTVIRGLYFEGWTLRHDPKHIRGREAMLARVAKELGSDHHLDPIDVLRAVIHLLVEHVSEGEIRDVVATLPRSIASLWQDLTGHAIDALPPRAHPTRHTGYHR